jgi:two-component system, LytTR family, response regulator
VSPESLRVLIADDEPLARSLLHEYASSVPGVSVVAEVENGDELAHRLSTVRSDVALVDIRMPGADVFGVLAHAAATHPPLPAVVFVTAFDAYAVRAFEMNAVDYLIKPFSRERLVEALRRARRHRAARTPSGLAAAIRDLGPQPDRLLVPDGRRFVPITVDEIVWIKAEADYSRIHARGRSYLVSRSMKELEKRLASYLFIRIHRSAMVQTAHIREVRPQGSSRYRVILSDGTTLIVSRTRAPELRRWRL